VRQIAGEEGADVSTLFSRIIDGELPGFFVWQDDLAVGFLSINPMGPGHTLVVPRAEVDNWVDADDALLGHLSRVAQRIGEGITAAWKPPRVALIIAGFEVPHLHLHVYPAWSMEDFDFHKAAVNPDPEDLRSDGESLRAALRHFGYGEYVPS
jgi:diadenosine tetraphosphate (Ap4A) HIT family hydrolase